MNKLLMQVLGWLSVVFILVIVTGSSLKIERIKFAIKQIEISIENIELKAPKPNATTQ